MLLLHPAAYLEELKAEALSLHALVNKEVQHTHRLQLDVCSLVNHKQLLPASLEASKDLQTAQQQNTLDLLP